MNQTNKPTSRATEIWSRFVGLFGGDAVARRFGDAPPFEWVSMIDRLRDHEIDRGMRRLVYSGRGHLPSLPEFVKLCRTVGSDDGIEDGPKPLALPNPDHWNGDDWDIEANHHLLAYVMRKALARQKLEQWQMEILLGFKKAWARDMREASQDGTKPADCGKAWFADCMRRAEEAMTQKAAA